MDAFLLLTPSGLKRSPGSHSHAVVDWFHAIPEINLAFDPEMVPPQ